MFKKNDFVNGLLHIYKHILKIVLEFNTHILNIKVQ